MTTLEKMTNGFTWAEGSVVVLIHFDHFKMAALLLFITILACVMGRLCFSFMKRSPGAPPDRHPPNLNDDGFPRAPEIRFQVFCGTGAGQPTAEARPPPTAPPLLSTTPPPGRVSFAGPASTTASTAPGRVPFAAPTSTTAPSTTTTTTTTTTTAAPPPPTTTTTTGTTPTPIRIATTAGAADNPLTLEALTLHLDLSHKRDELSAMCKQRKIPSSGLKRDIAQRLARHRLMTGA